MKQRMSYEVHARNVRGVFVPKGTFTENGQAIRFSSLMEALTAIESYCRMSREDAEIAEFTQKDFKVVPVCEVLA